MCNQRDYGMLYDQLRQEYRKAEADVDKATTGLKVALHFFSVFLPQEHGMVCYLTKLIEEIEVRKQNRAVYWNGATFKAGL